MVMVSNNGGFEMGVLAGANPDLIGHLYGPDGKRGPYRGVSFGIDADVYGPWSRGVPWQEAPWFRLLEWAQRARYAPLWAVVPDVIADREGTLRRWDRYAPLVERMGFRRAFVLQDGMTFADVPEESCALFVGGSTSWKEAAIAPWCARFPGRVHVGRVTEWDRLMKCYRAGAVSVDGNGWWRKTNKPGQGAQFEALNAYVEMVRTERKAA